MTLTRYVWDKENDSHLIESVVGNDDCTLTQQPYLYGNLISSHRDEGSKYYHLDGVYSTVQYTDDNSEIMCEQLHAAFGEKILGNSGCTPTPGYVGALGYSSHEGDLNIYVRDRIYSPEMGRWESLDPEGAVDGINMFRYVQNNPANNVDPSGNKLIIVGFEGFGADGIGKFKSHAFMRNYFKKKAAKEFGGSVIFIPHFQKITSLRSLTELGKIIRETEARAKKVARNDGCEKCFDKLMIMGYSYGGQTAALMVENMAKLVPNLKIDAVLTIDPVFGPYAFSTKKNIMKKMKGNKNFCEWFNFYQTDDTHSLLGAKAINRTQLPQIHGDQLLWEVSEEESFITNTKLNFKGKAKGTAHIGIPARTEVLNHFIFYCEKYVRQQGWTQLACQRIQEELGRQLPDPQLRDQGVMLTAIEEKL